MKSYSTFWLPTSCIKPAYEIAASLKNLGKNRHSGVQFELGSLRFSYAHYIVHTEPIVLQNSAVSLCHWYLLTAWIWPRLVDPPTYHFLQILHGPLVDRHLIISDELSLLLRLIWQVPAQHCRVFWDFQEFTSKILDWKKWQFHSMEDVLYKGTHKETL